MSYAATIDHGCNAIVKVYRDRNRKVRTAPAPEYFDDDISLKDRIVLGLPDVNLVEGISKGFQGTLTDLMETANKVRADLQSIAADRRAKLREFIDAVEAAAQKRLDDDTRFSQ
jgi:hypothetical protein